MNRQCSHRFSRFSTRNFPLPHTGILWLLFCWIYGTSAVKGEKSVARKWMEAGLQAVKVEGQGPTVHARNIFHATIAMYDAWAVYDQKAKPYLLGNKIGAFSCHFDPSFKIPDQPVDSLRNIAITYAAYRVLWFRFNLYGSKGRTIEGLDSLFAALGGVVSNRSTDYMSGSPIAMGNYIAACVIDYGMQDGSKEINNYEADHYFPSNPPLKPNHPGTRIRDQNRWQPLSLREYMDIKGGDMTLPEWVRLLIFPQDLFLTPEWGDVMPFALTAEDRKMMNRDEINFTVYMDPGSPPLIGTGDTMATKAYQWGFLLNIIWSSHLDPSDSVKIDISPGTLGNTLPLPENYEDYDKFYDLPEGGVKTTGRKLNPYTQKPYEPNIVLRADYTRVIAEYWVDAANTVTPPGHWITTMLDVSDHPLFEKRWRGKGPVLNDLEWDVKANFLMTSAMHDAAIAAWSIKGYYDYVRPITAIRWMAQKGQSSDKNLPNYHPDGLPLVKGRVELVTKKDPLAGENKEHVNKIKLYCWRGPDYIQDPDNDIAGVGWILAENWWPYQRFSFATPPFAGFISGHSTFSTAGAEVLTLITGDPYFPGGLSELTFKKDNFLKFERGPTRDITLQWATYRDAADETCLSRIWGGIHPPADDIPARVIGKAIGEKAFQKASKYFNGQVK